MTTKSNIVRALAALMVMTFSVQGCATPGTSSDRGSIAISTTYLASEPAVSGDFTKSSPSSSRDPDWDRNLGLWEYFGPPTIYANVAESSGSLRELGGKSSLVVIGSLSSVSYALLPDQDVTDGKMGAFTFTVHPSNDPDRSITFPLYAYDGIDLEHVRAKMAAASGPYLFFLTAPVSSETTTHRCNDPWLCVLGMSSTGVTSVIYPGKETLLTDLTGAAQDSLSGALKAAGGAKG